MIFVFIINFEISISLFKLNYNFNNKISEKKIKFFLFFLIINILYKIL